jgi:hypothetical protein
MRQHEQSKQLRAYPIAQQRSVGNMSILASSSDSKISEPAHFSSLYGLRVPQILQENLEITTIVAEIDGHVSAIKTKNIVLNKLIANKETETFRLTQSAEILNEQLGILENSLPNTRARQRKLQPGHCKANTVMDSITQQLTKDLDAEIRGKEQQRR